MATTTSETQLFDDAFTITSINSAKYERVSRISAHNLSNDTVLTLDVNTELYPCSTGDTVHVVLSATLDLDGAKDEDKGWREAQRGEASLADMYDYVCHGKIYRFEEGEGDSMWVPSTLAEMDPVFLLLIVWASQKGIRLIWWAVALHGGAVPKTHCPAGRPRLPAHEEIEDGEVMILKMAAGSTSSQACGAVLY